MKEKSKSNTVTYTSKEIPTSQSFSLVYLPLHFPYYFSTTLYWKKVKVKVSTTSTCLIYIGNIFCVCTICVNNLWDYSILVKKSRCLNFFFMVKSVFNLPIRKSVGGIWSRNLFYLSIWIRNNVDSSIFPNITSNRCKMTLIFLQ